jgi:hypothetical protein
MRRSRSIAALVLALAATTTGLLAPATVSATVTNPRIVWAAGDISCDPNDPNETADFNNGRGETTTNTECQMLEVANMIREDTTKDRVLALGDLQYEDGTLTEFNGSYSRTWGSNTTLSGSCASLPCYRYTTFRPMTEPVPGNHEYQTTAAQGYRDYWGAKANWDTVPNSAHCAIAAGCGFYSIQIGTEWLGLALNTNCGSDGLGPDGCADQAAWITSVVNAQASHGDASERQCIIAFGHHPRWSTSGREVRQGVIDLYDSLFANHVDIYLAGHEHWYGRWPSMDDQGDMAAATGVRQFIVGTGGVDIEPAPSWQDCKDRNGGGACLESPEQPQYIHNSDVASTWNTDFGALRLRLGDASYDGRWVKADTTHSNGIDPNGDTIDDFGEKACY